MTSKDVEHILRKDEGLSLEFKKAGNSLPKNLFETVCAFLNREGGTILLGVSDSKKVLGLNKNIADRLCKEVTNLSNNPQKLDPPFLLHPKCVDLENKTLVSIFIPASSQVHKTAGKVFDRSSDGDFVLTSDEQISRMYMRKSSYYS